jgi:hypothetical protein
MALCGSQAAGGGDAYLLRGLRANLLHATLQARRQLKRSADARTPQQERASIITE